MMPGETVGSGAVAPEGAVLQVVGRGGTWYVAFIEEDGSAFSRETIYFATESMAIDTLFAMKDLDVEEWQTIRGVRT